MDATKLPLLATLEVLLREQSVREAARMLAISPSTVSRHLGQLRALVGDPLFVRHGNTMVATERARMLSAELTPRLRDLGRLLSTTPTFDPGASETRFTVAVADAVFPTFIPRLLDRLAQDAPRVALQFVPTAGPVEALGQALASGATDLYLGPPIGLSEGIVRKKLFDAGFLCLARRDHPEVGDELDLATFCRLRHVLVSSRFPARSWVDEALEQMGRRRVVSVTTPYFLGAAHLAACTDLIATLPDRPARALAASLGLRVFPVPVDLPAVPFFLLWHERHRAAPDHAWLRGMVEAAVSQSDAEWPARPA